MTYTTMRTRAAVAPYLFIAMSSLAGLLPGAPVLDWVAVAVGVWLLYTQLRDKRVVRNELEPPKLDEDPAFVLGAMCLGPFLDDDVVVVDAQITKGLHDDGPRFNARVQVGRQV